MLQCKMIFGTSKICQLEKFWNQICSFFLTLLLWGILPLQLPKLLSSVSVQSWSQAQAQAQIYWGLGATGLW